MIGNRLEVKRMLYCARCQVLVKSEAVCPSCGSKKLREVRANDPVLLFTADETQCGMIRAAFDSNGTPHEERMCGPGAPPSILYGKMPNSLYHIFVPYGEVERCEEILHGIGALGENKFERNGPQNSDDDSSAAMSRGKRILVRILSAVMFLALVWGVVSIADEFINFIKSALT
ncbi:hypothetical protein [Caproicibacter sp.]|uniref:hypothetical protein n=1 Tax=Caproicibacter sp. TaxID=2814884 RepID=UPI00398928EC